MPDYTLTDSMLSTLPEGFGASFASLSEQGQQHAFAMLEEAAANGTLHEIDTGSLLSDATALDEAHDEFDRLQRDQQDAIEEGDWETARDRAFEAEYEMREVSDIDGGVEDEIVEAEGDVAEIDDAMDNAEAADTAAADAASYADAGMTGAAEVYADSAVDYSAAADASIVEAQPVATNYEHDVDGDGID